MTISHDKGIFEKHVQTLLLSLITALVIAMSSFLWNLNAKLAQMEERDRMKTQIINDLQIVVNKMQLDIYDMKEKMIRLEK